MMLALAVMPLALAAQDRYGTRAGNISFFSETPVENIEAHNNKVSSVWDAASGAMEFAVLIKSFECEKALMQEHFNENYMESNTHPKATFKGKMEGVTADQLRTPGTYDVKVAGDLTIHGVTKQVVHPGKITVGEDGKVRATSEFIVVPEDHAITIPGVVRDNIAKEITVKVDMDYSKL